MIKKFIPAAVGLAFCVGVGVANAGNTSHPTELTLAKMDSVTAGGLLNIAPQTNLGPQANLNVLGFGVKQSNSQSNVSSGKGGYAGKSGYDQKHVRYDKHGGYEGGKHSGGYDGGNKWCKQGSRGGDYHQGGKQGNTAGNKEAMVNIAPQTNVGPQANVNVLGFKVAQSNWQSNRN